MTNRPCFTPPHSHFRPQNRGRKKYGHEAFSDISSIAAMPHIAQYFSERLAASSSPKWCNTPHGHLVSPRHICAIPHFATCRSIVAQCPHKNEHDITLRYYRCKYRAIWCWASYPDLPFLVFLVFLVFGFPLFSLFLCFFIPWFLLVFLVIFPCFLPHCTSKPHTQTPNTDPQKHTHTCVCAHTIQICENDAGTIPPMQLQVAWLTCAVSQVVWSNISQARAVMKSSCTPQRRNLQKL